MAGAPAIATSLIADHIHKTLIWTQFLLAQELNCVLQDHRQEARISKTKFA